MTSEEALRIFRDTGALLDGHFVLRSGRHSRQFFQCALALQKMSVVEKLGADLSGRVRDLGATTVVAPAMGGLVIGQEVARQLGIRFIFVEKENNSLALRRGFKICTGEKILIVEDVITTGKSAIECSDIVKSFKANVIGYACIIDRSGKNLMIKDKIISQIKIDIPAFNPDQLPDNLKNIKPVKPGSRNIS